MLFGSDYQWSGHFCDGGGGDRWSQVMYFEVQLVVELRSRIAPSVALRLHMFDWLHMVPFSWLSRRVSIWSTWLSVSQ